ncbi:TrkH family potassium uptake protein [Anaerovorax odorimutans]|uniref:TrkH family potassium uptake protein n=1 Tax=Anaerovorax odorimutans TaxID=109327 RepID=UPI00210E9F15|nr:potassium transporter TrkG [Anaerovorax odorimutans]
MSFNTSLNYQAIVKILGVITLIVGISMLPALFCAHIYKEPSSFKALLISSAVTIAAGGLTVLLIRPVKAKFRAREGYLVVALCWIIASLFGTLPYYLSDYTNSFIDGFFESTAGFTTTGCTSIGAGIMPNSLLMWKAISHWLGGMGILVFVISILPTLGINGQMIARAEAPGPVLEKMAVRMSDSAKILYLMYFSFTVIEFVMLALSPSMSPFDALINTMGSISTGGLVAHPNGIAYYNSVYVEIVISVFTILASVNFVLYHYAIKRQWKYVLKDIELRAFLRILIGAVLLCTLGLYFLGNAPSFGKALRDSFFQVISVATTSGYSSADYTLWPVLCQMILFTLMFIGGCAASTCGSIKVIRIVVLLKLIGRGFYKRIHPRSVVAVKLRGKAVPAPVVSAITVFILMYMGLFLFSCLILSLQNLDLETTITTSAAMLSNTGMAFGQVGALGNYSMFGGGLKLYLSLLMIVGRLELFTIVILFTRNFWGRDR